MRSISLIFVFSFLITSVAQAGSSFLLVKCRVQSGSGSSHNVVEAFFIDPSGDTPFSVTPEGVLTVRGHRAILTAAKDSSAADCPFEYRQAERVCHPLRTPPCQSEVVWKHSETNIVQVSPSPGNTLMTCAVGSSVEEFAEREAWLDALHTAKFPKPKLDVIGTRLDPLKRACLR